MDFKFNKDTESKQPAPVEKGRKNSLVLLLLILVAGFCYLYFFTSLIRPQQEQKLVQAPVPQVIKKPLPFPAVQNAALPPASEEGTLQAAPGQVKPTPAPTANSAVQEVKKSGDALKAAVPNSTEKKIPPAPVVTAQKESSAAKKSDAKKTPAIVASSSTPASATSAAKRNEPIEKKAPKEKETLAAGETKTKTKKLAAAKPAKKTKPAIAVAVGPWTVVVGTYMLEDAMATDMVRVRNAGLDASVQPGPRKKTFMTRLYVAEFPERGAAQTELNKLKRHTSDAFILDQGGSFAVFAGSYLLDGRAASEKERLAAAGFPVTLKRVDVAIPTKKLTAGKFNDKSAAEAAFKRLKEAGFKPALAR